MSCVDTIACGQCPHGIVDIMLVSTLLHIFTSAHACSSWSAWLTVTLRSTSRKSWCSKKVKPISILFSLKLIKAEQCTHLKFFFLIKTFGNGRPRNLKIMLWQRPTWCFYTLTLHFTRCCKLKMTQCIQCIHSSSLED